MTVVLLPVVLEPPTLTPLVGVVCTACGDRLSLVTADEAHDVAPRVDRAHRCGSLLESPEFLAAVAAAVAGVTQ